jgi:hypothetical protein
MMKQQGVVGGVNGRVQKRPRGSFCEWSLIARAAAERRRDDAPPLTTDNNEIPSGG